MASVPEECKEKPQHEVFHRDLSHFRLFYFEKSLVFKSGQFEITVSIMIILYPVQ